MTYTVSSGTLNSSIPYHTMDSFTSHRSFMYGRSTANQRTEFLWGVLRRQCLQYLMDILGVLQDYGFFSGDPIDKQLIRFCYMNIIQVWLISLTYCVCVSIITLSSLRTVVHYTAYMCSIALCTILQFFI